MKERITVTISDSLYKRLQQVKNSLNVSGVCQQAIEIAVSIEEIKRKDIPNMEKLIERLQLEKQQDVESWKQTGVNDGKEDAMELSYEEFKNLEASESISDELLEWIQSRRIEYLENVDRDAYLKGWLEGALTVWDEVKQRI